MNTNMENAKYVCSYIAQNVNNQYINGVLIPLPLDELYDILEKENYCICGYIMNQNNQIKRKNHMKYCILKKK